MGDGECEEYDCKIKTDDALSGRILGKTTARLRMHLSEEHLPSTCNILCLKPGTEKKIA